MAMQPPNDCTRYKLELLALIYEIMVSEGKMEQGRFPKKETTKIYAPALWQKVEGTLDEWYQTYNPYFCEDLNHLAFSSRNLKRVFYGLFYGGDGQIFVREDRVSRNGRDITYFWFPSDFPTDEEAGFGFDGGWLFGHYTITIRVYRFVATVAQWLLETGRAPVDRLYTPGVEW